MTVEQLLWMAGSFLLGVMPLGFWLMRYHERLALARLSLAERDKDLNQAWQDLQNFRMQNDEYQTRLARSEERALRLDAELESEKRQHAERISAYQQAEERLKDVFKVLSVDALKSNHQSLIQVAEAVFAKYDAQAKERFERKEEAIANLVKPVYQSLEKFENKVQDLEKQREGAYQGLTQQVRGLLELQQRLQAETSQLSHALRSPTARGRWGELQLRRVVEMAGMLAHCDFFEQAQARQTDAKSLRPDMVIKLPGNRSIVVDAKAPLKAYLDAIETPDETRRQELLNEHAQLIRRQISALSQKSYWERIEGSPEFVLLFLPGESYFSAALQADPQLIEVGAQQKVILATPTTLIALLRTTAYAWRQEAMAENARLVGKLGKELYCRIADLSGHFNDLGRSLKQSVQSYNRAVGSLESRVLVTARRFRDLEVDDAKKDVKELALIDEQARDLELASKM